MDVPNYFHKMYLSFLFKSFPCVNKYAYPCSYHHITVDTYPKIDRLPQLIGTSQFYLLLPNEYRKEAYQEFNMETGQSHVLVNNSAFIYGHKMTEYPCSSFPTRFCLASLLMAGQCTLYQPKFTQIKHREPGESRRNRWPIYDGLRRVFLSPSQYSKQIERMGGYCPEQIILSYRIQKDSLLLKVSNMYGNVTSKHFCIMEEEVKDKRRTAVIPLSIQICPGLMEHIVRT